MTNEDRLRILVKEIAELKEWSHKVQNNPTWWQSAEEELLEKLELNTEDC